VQMCVSNKKQVRQPGSSLEQLLPRPWNTFS
jgi:hypothetical protein